MAIAVPDGSTGIFTRSVPIAPYGDKTIAAWVKMPHANTAGHACGFCTLYNTNITGEYFLTYDGGIEITARNFSGQTINAGISLIANNTWRHLVGLVTATADPTTVTNCAIYLDGVLNQSVSAGGPVPQFANVGTGTWIGNQPQNYGTSDTSVDYVAVWNRLLTPTEITQLYNQTDPRYIQPGFLQTFVSLSSATSNADLAPLASGITWTASGTGITTSAAPFALAPYNPVGAGIPIAPTTTIDQLCNALFTTRGGSVSGAPTYYWSDTGVLQALWSDTSMITARFTARGVAPSVLRL